MKKYKKEIVKATAKEVLLNIFNLALPFFESSSVYRVSARKYRSEFIENRPDLLEKIRYLKKQGLIENFIENKEKYLEITPKGLERIKKLKEDDLAIERPAVWDGKWRVVIFDIPNKNRVARDMFRSKLIYLGFVKIQESVYVYPFECTEVVTNLTEKYLINNNVLIMISEIIQGEENIIINFLDKKILTTKDIKKK